MSARSLADGPHYSDGGNIEGGDGVVEGGMVRVGKCSTWVGVERSCMPARYLCFTPKKKIHFQFQTISLSTCGTPQYASLVDLHGARERDDP